MHTPHVKPALTITGTARRRLLGVLPASAAVAWAGSASAQAWPTKPIRIVAAQAPGSSNDNTARAFADYLSTQLGTTVLVENKPGGVGMIAAELVAHSPPDGYTFLLTLHSQLAQAPVLLKKVPIDTRKDLVPVASISTGIGPMVVKKDLPVTSLAELIELARKRPVSVGNYGIGSGWQLQVTQLAKQTGAQFDLVNYKGTGPMIIDLVAGQIDVGAGSLAGLGPAIQRGAARPIVIISGGRSNKLPGVPTWADAGVTGPAFENLVECNMLLAPAGTPNDVVERVAGLIRESVVKSDKVKMVQDQLGSSDVPLTGDELRQFIDRSWPTYQQLTREMGLSIG